LINLAPVVLGWIFAVKSGKNLSNKFSSGEFSGELNYRKILRRVIFSGKNSNENFFTHNLTLITCIHTYKIKIGKASCEIETGIFPARNPFLHRSKKRLNVNADFSNFQTADASVRILVRGKPEVTYLHIYVQ
jgi:hypothetical protein